MGTVSIYGAILIDGVLLFSCDNNDTKQYLAVTKDKVGIINKPSRADLKIISEDLSSAIYYYHDEGQPLRILDTKNGLQPIPILSSIYDSSSYKEALFAADDNCIIYSDKNNQFHYLDLYLL